MIAGEAKLLGKWKRIFFINLILKPKNAFLTKENTLGQGRPSFLSKHDESGDFSVPGYEIVNKYREVFMTRYKNLTVNYLHEIIFL